MAVAAALSTEDTSTKLDPESVAKAPGGIMSEDQAVARIAQMLDPEATTPGSADKDDEDRDEVRRETEPEASEEEAQEVSPDDEKTDKTESEGDDDEELPDTLASLAQALEMSAEDLSTHLKVPIKVAGRTSEVTLDEAIRGYQREQDYSRRKDELAEQRRQIETQNSGLEQERKQQMEELGTLAQALQQRVNGVTDEFLMRVFQEQGQEEYLKWDMQRKHDQALLEQVKGEGRKLVQEQESKVKEYRGEQQRLLADVDPDFRTEETARKAQEQMVGYLKGRNFKADEISAWFDGPFDHRHVQVIRDAARYRDLMEKSKTVGKTVKKQGRIKRAGSIEDHKAPNKLGSLRQRVRQNRGRSRTEQRDSGVALISEMLKGE